MVVLAWPVTVVTIGLVLGLYFLWKKFTPFFAMLISVAGRLCPQSKEIFPASAQIEQI